MNSNSGNYIREFTNGYVDSKLYGVCVYTQDILHGCCHIVDTDVYYCVIR